MREAVADEPQFASLQVLFDRIERLLLRDFHFCIRPARDFHDHVEDAIALVSEKRDIMERGEDRAPLLNVHPVVYVIDECLKFVSVSRLTESVGGTN